MGNLKNILIHCQENEEKYKKIMDYDINDVDELMQDEARLINYGWIQALRFVQSNFDVEFNTIAELDKHKEENT
tara:strand:- start:685 stop:906 length:222 start_codon:yes stop_codon:yes gene_type:complete